jgi:uncharacterized protein Smg (DUF494 family)
MNNHIVQILDFLLRHSATKTNMPKLPKPYARKPNAVKFSIETKQELIDQLHSMGFGITEIKGAFEWLLKLMAQQFDLGNNVWSQSSAMRVFLDVEIEKIGRENCDFIMSLVNTNILNSKTREIVITQLMELPQPVCSEIDVKWVIFMVLASQYNNVSVKNQIEQYTLWLAPKLGQC